MSVFHGLARSPGDRLRISGPRPATTSRGIVGFHHISHSTFCASAETTPVVRIAYRA
jgi:hypothetical protein